MVRQLLQLLLAFTILSANMAWADEAALDWESAELFDSVMSPYCPGRTLSACPSDDARLLRESLRAQLAAGKSVAELRGQVIKEFDVAGKPEGAASISLAYVGVGAFFVIGIALVCANIRKANVQSGDAEHVEEEG